MSPVDRERLRAPCKINLHLAVGWRREDGFHSIKSIFLALDLCDTLEIELTGETDRPGAPVGLEVDVSGLPSASAAPLKKLLPEKNIVYRAALLFFEASGLTPHPLAIKLTKRIPSGAGLGGASSDAASTLLALNRMTGFPLDAGSLCRAAARLGSDVPFFLSGGAAFVAGRGEIVKAIPAPEIYAVLVNPLFESGTARAFSLLDEYRAAKKPESPEKNPAREELIARLPRAPEDWPYTNDFLPALLALGSGEEKKAYGAMLRDLKKAGAEFVSLSGSGSTCFGIFLDKSKAEAAVDVLRGKRWFVLGPAPSAALRDSSGEVYRSAAECFPVMDPARIIRAFVLSDTPRETQRSG
jgi:4-diphosphocytidyl-2-C-methyl-D-erythritol kinase